MSKRVPIDQPPTDLVPGETAAVICRAFGAVLGRTDVGPDDSFFALGGDSIGSIQVVSRARRDGLRFTAADVFEYRTPAALAELCGRSMAPGSVSASSTHADAAGHGVVEFSISAADLVEATPDADGPAAGYGQYVVVHLPDGAPTGRVALALQALLDTHEMLRAQVEQVTPGVWITRTRAVGTVTAAERLVEATSADGGVLSRQLQFRAELDRATALLSPTAGQVFRAVLLRGNGDRLLLLCHHLVIDGVSWRILLDDLRQAWHRNAAPIVLDEVPTSFRRWTATVGELARSAERTAELPGWLRSLRGTGTALTGPADRGTYGESASLRLELGPETAGPLLGSVPQVYGVEINDVLLGSLGLAIAEWSRRRGERGHPGDNGATAPQPLIEVEGHGRESLGDLDLSRTVGWFTTMFPFVAATGLATPLQSVTPPEIERTLASVAERRGSLADHGIGWGMLRYLNPQTRGVLQRVAVPEFGFNYLGRFAVSQEGSTADAPGEPWTLDSRDLPDGVAIGTATDPSMPLRHSVAVTASTQDGTAGPSLVMNWRWSPGLLARAEVEDLARTWQLALQIVTRAARAEFDAELPATAIQRGLIFQSHLDEDGRDLYVIQVDAQLDGMVDTDRLRAAVTDLLDRHPMLRAGSGFDRDARPVLRVGADAMDLPWFEHDLSNLEPSAQELAIQTIAEDARVRRFDLTRPPLMRCHLVRVAEFRFRFVWTLHHLLVDGWSMGVLIRDLLAGYAGLSPGQKVRSAPGLAVYRDHANQLAGRDTSASRGRWSTALAGVASPCRVVPDDPDRGLVEPDRLTVSLPAEQTAELHEFARCNDLTVNTVVQFAWASVLAEHLGRDDVLFGATVSNRPAAHPDADGLVGLFLNTLPVRVRLTRDEPVISQLRQLQSQQAALRSDPDVALSEIVAGHPTLGDGGEPFDTTVVFENFPAPPETAESTLPFAVRSVSVWDARHYPLSVVVIPGRQLLLRIDYQGNAVSTVLAGECRDRLVAAIGLIVAGDLPRFSGSAGPSAGADTVEPAHCGVVDPAVEAAVIMAFQAVLGRDDVDRETNFFLFGGDSIAAIHVVARLREQAIVVTPRDVFGRRTPAAIAAVCRTSALVDVDPDPFQLTDDELDLLDDELGVNL